MAGGQEAKKHLYTDHNNTGQPQFRINLYNPSYM